jgi:hypothetical protein
MATACGVPKFISPHTPALFRPVETDDDAHTSFKMSKRNSILLADDISMFMGSQTSLHGGVLSLLFSSVPLEI